MEKHGFDGRRGGCAIGRAWAAGVVALAALIMGARGAPAQEVQSPEEFLGHQVGEDFKIAPWSKIHAYFLQLGEQSDRVNVRELGTTTDGRPFIVAEISDAATIADLAPHRLAQRKIADPRLIADEAEERRLIQESKVAILVNCQLHSTETAASQMAMELAYDLAVGDSPEILEILRRTIIVLIPCANPDGQAMVAEWYEKTLGKPWEGGGMPWLYQHYAGHDNNRDWFMLNLKETRLTTQRASIKRMGCPQSCGTCTRWATPNRPPVRTARSTIRKTRMSTPSSTKPS